MGLISGATGDGVAILTDGLPGIHIRIKIIPEPVIVIQKI